MMEVEVAGVFVEGFHHNTDRSNFQRVLPTSIQRVHQEESPETAAPARTGDRQSAKQRCGEVWVTGQLSRNRFRQFAELESVSRERVVAGDCALAVDQDERCGHLP